MKSSLIRINLIFILLVLFIPNLTVAELRTFIKEYTYQASEEDSRNSSRSIAMREVKRLLLEELGSYLESVTDVKNFQLTKDQITTLTAGIVNTEIVDEKWDGHIYWLKAKIMADATDVIKSIDTLRKDRVKTKELEALRKRSEKLLMDNENLRKELTVAKGEKRQQKIAAYDENIKYLGANEWFERGYSFGVSGNYNNAVDAFSKAIELQPKSAEAYNNRGLAYHNLHQHKRAIEDYNEAIRLKPDYAEAYNNRGNDSYQHQRAIADYNEAIRLKPDYAEAYNNRGNTYHKLGQHQRAINDYTKAIRLKPDLAGAYLNRGIAYGSLGQHQRAIKDNNEAIRLDSDLARSSYKWGFYYEGLGQYKDTTSDYDKSIRLKPDDAELYVLRGGNYYILGQYQRAIDDYNEAIRLKPDYAEAYNNRGNAYILSGNNQEACRSFIRACQLGVCTGYELSKQKDYCQQHGNKTKSSVDTDQRYRVIKGIVLMNGNIIEGKIISWDPDTVKLRTKDGKVLSYDFKKEVQRFITE